MRETATAGLALGAAGGLLAACSGSSSKSTGSSGAAKLPFNRDPGTLVVAVDAWSPNFDPAASALVSVLVSVYGMYEGLVRMKGSSATEVEPVLAQSYEANADKSTWTFKMRPGVQFSDGTPCDAAAVKAAYTRTIEAKLGEEYIIGTYVTDPGSQMVVKDPGTLVFDLGAPVPRFDLLLASQYGCLIPNPNVEQKGKNFGHDYLRSHSAGTGAFMIESVQPNDQLVMVRNPHYWRGWDSTRWEKVIIRQVEEGSVRRQGIESGDFDVAYASTAQDTEALRENPGVSVGNQKDVGIEYIILGCYGPLASPEARQAMNLLFPVEQFTTDVMKGTLATPTSVLPDLMLYSQPTYTPTVDVEKAKQLLAQAGVQPGTELTYEYYTGFRQEPGLIMQQQLQQVGLKLKLVQKAFSAFAADQTTDRPESERASMYYWSWWPDYNDPADFCYPILSGEATPKAGLYNSGYYLNDRVTKIINESYTESDEAKQTEMWHEAQVIMGQTDPPWIPTGQIIDTSYLRADIDGYVPNPLYIQTFDYYALTRSG